jgi:hypothetical protein
MKDHAIIRPGAAPIPSTNDHRTSLSHVTSRDVLKPFRGGDPEVGRLTALVTLNRHVDAARGAAAGASLTRMFAISVIRAIRGFVANEVSLPSS